MRIAIIGNGPLGLGDRKALNAGFDLVVRFGSLGNMYCNEAADVWVLRGGPHTLPGLPGIGRGCKIAQVAEKVKSVWLVGGDAADFGNALRTTPEIDAAVWVHFPLPAWQQRYFNASREPSLGWIGLLAAKECAPKDATFDLFGFNWAKGPPPAAAGKAAAAKLAGGGSSSSEQGPDWAAEKSFVGRLVAAGAVRVHPTACASQAKCAYEGIDKLVLTDPTPQPAEQGPNAAATEHQLQWLRGGGNQPGTELGLFGAVPRFGSGSRQGAFGEAAAGAVSSV